MKILLLENERDKKREPWYWGKINIPSDFKVNYYNIPEVSLWEALPRLMKGYFISFRYDVLVTRQCLYSVIIYSFLFKIFRRRKTKLVIEGFQTNEKRNDLRSFLKYNLLKFCLSSATVITCYSKNEISYYIDDIGLDKNKLRFIPLAINFDYPHEFNINDSDYILCAGRTGRDYKSFFDAIKGLKVNVVVVTDYSNLSGLKIPENVTVKYNISLNELSHLIAKAGFCVTSLKDKFISVGQRVALHYMAMGKAQIATDIPPMKGYITEGETGILSPPYDPVRLRKNIKYLLDNPNLCKEMGKKAREYIYKFHVIDKYYNDFFSLIREYCQD